MILATEEVRELSEMPKKEPREKEWVSCLSDYKRRLYGEEILAILRDPKPPKRRRGRRR